MLFRKENGFEWWMKGIVPSGCEVVKNGYHICKEDRSEHYVAETYKEAEDKFIELTGGKRFGIGKTPYDNLSVDSAVASQKVKIGVSKNLRVSEDKRKKVEVVGKGKKIKREKGPPPSAKIEKKRFVII